LPSTLGRARGWSLRGFAQPTEVAESPEVASHGKPWHLGSVPARERPLTKAALVLAAKLAGVPIQEAQSLLVELGRALVNGSVCAGLEHEKLATIDYWSARQRSVAR
jgi:hypothetical protein